MFSSERRRSNQIAALYGYKVSGSGKPASAFKVGETVIVYNKNYDPIFEGIVEDINSDSLKIMDQWFHDIDHTFELKD